MAVGFESGLADARLELVCTLRGRCREGGALYAGGRRGHLVRVRGRVRVRVRARARVRARVRVRVRAVDAGTGA